MVSKKISRYFVLLCLLSSGAMIFADDNCKEPTDLISKEIDSRISSIHKCYNSKNADAWDDEVFKRSVLLNEAAVCRSLVDFIYRRFLDNQCVVELPAIDSEDSDVKTQLLKDIIMKWKNPIYREMGVYFLYDHLIGYGEARNKLISLEQGDLFDICSSLVKDNDINVRRAAYKLFNDYLLASADRYYIKSSRDIIGDPKFEDLFKLGLSDQDNFVQGYALQIRRFFIQYYLNSAQFKPSRFNIKNVHCDQSDFELFKKAFNDESRFMHKRGLAGLKSIVECGFFKSEIFDIAHKYVASNQDENLKDIASIVDSFLCNGYKANDYNNSFFVNEVKKLVQSSDQNEQVFACLILTCLRCVTPEEMDEIGKDLKPIIDKTIIDPILNSESPTGIFGRFVEQDFLYNIVGYLWNYNHAASICDIACNNPNNIALRRAATVNTFDLIYSGDFVMQAEGVKNIMLNFYEHKPHCDHPDQYICENILVAIEVCFHNYRRYSELHIGLIGLCAILVDCHYGVDRIIKIVNAMNCFNHVVILDMLNLSRMLAKYPDFCEKGLLLTSLFDMGGSEFVFGELYKSFWQNLIQTCVTSGYRIDDIKRKAEQRIKENRDFYDYDLGFFMYSKLVQNGACLNECAAFIKENLKNSDIKIGMKRGFANLYRDLLGSNSPKKDAIAKEASDCAKLLGKDDIFIDDVLSLYECLVEAGYAYDDAVAFLNIVKSKNDSNLEYSIKDLSNALEHRGLKY